MTKSTKLSRTSLLSILGLTALAGASAHATDGYFDYGYGVQSKGIGGAGVAFPQDALAPAANPAGAAFLDDRFDIGLSYLRPDRSVSVGGTQTSGDGVENFYIPEIGFKRALADKWDFDLAIYGNGGMNTDYTGLPVPFGPGHVGVDLEQLFAAPTIAYKINDKNAIGIDPIFALQRFRAYGLEYFGVGNNGYDYSYGGGVRIGYTSKLADWLTVGATYQSRIFTTKLDKYDNLFAEQGSFDIPSNFGLGVAVEPQKQVTLALDVERIFYSDVNAVGDSGQVQAPLGSNHGPGFGWRDVTAVKTGIAYDVTKSLTLRVGYNYSTQPIPDSQTFFNVLAPAVIQQHVTSGVTWRFAHNWEASAFYTHAFEQQVNGVPYSLRMSQETFGVSLGWLL
jgi:long-chain fatty acid transport protein